MPDALDPRSLLVFRYIGQEGSIAGAARALGWTQPAVSQHVRRLERATGVVLVVRSGRTIGLTDAGRELMRHAETLDGEVNAAQQTMNRFRNGKTGRVRVAAFPSAGATFVVDAIAEAQAEAEDVEFSLQQLEPEPALGRLRAAEIDLAVVFEHTETPVQRTWRRIPLAEDEIRLVVPESYSRETKLAALADEPWIAGSPTCREGMVAVCATSGFVPRVVHATEDYVVAQRMVARGLGFAMIPALALTATMLPGIRHLRLEPRVARQVAVIARREALAMPATRLLVEHIRAAAPRTLEPVATVA